MLLHDTAFRVEHERSRQRGNAAVLEADFVAGNGDGIVDAEFFNKSLDGAPIVIVHHEAKNLETVLVFVLKADEVGNFGPAGPAPGGPKIQEDDFAPRVRESDGLAVEASQSKVRRGIGVTDEPDGRLPV